MYTLTLILVLSFYPRQPKDIWEPVDAKVTAYCPCAKCCGVNTGITASGYKIQKGNRLVAAPKEIAFHSLVLVEGYNDGKPVEVLDRGGAIKFDGKLYKIDVYFDSHEEALKWGVKYITVYIKR